MPFNPNAKDFEDRAEAGDGMFAIAYAILQLAQTTQNVASALNRLGTADAATPMGALEAHGKHMGECLEAFGHQIAGALEDAASIIAKDP